MSETDHNIIILPEEALPDKEELTGDLRLLADVVGVAKALEIGQMFCGTPIRCYNVKRYLRRWRDRQIRKEYDNGMSAIALARKYQLTDRQIWNILGSPEPDERQIGLFEG